MRAHERRPDEPRKVRITRGFTSTAPGSVLVEAGQTRLLCTAMVENQVPAWLRGSGSGWVTAEYAMLPGSTRQRKPREARTGKTDARALEIQRLIGRSLRAVTNLQAFPDRAVWLDCDVLEADGGTRTLAVTGSWVALHDAFAWMEDQDLLETWPLSTQVAAVSVGVVDGEPLLDLDYEEDSRAEVDLNVVMTAREEFVEIQGTAEKAPFSRETLETLLDLARKGIGEILEIQAKAVEP